MTEPGDGASTRRTFLASGGALAATALIGPGAPARAAEPVIGPGPGPQSEPPPAEASGSATITEGTIAEAEKLAAIELDADEREEIVRTIEENIERARARRAIDLPHDLAPALTFDPRLPGMPAPPASGAVVPSAAPPGPLPAKEEDIAFAPVTRLSAWLESGAITSTRLTEIALARLDRFAPVLECEVTRTRDLALAQAREADEEIAAGRRRGPLHGIPWGAKDLFDTANIRTSWGATPYQGRVPERDAYVVRRLREAGAVLVAKLTLGALAYGDIWFGGKTRNPWSPEQGSSGSSAGSAAATAAGLVGFALGTETLGSIVSPCMRCGTTGLRPTFGRVARTGAMALCWSLDKIGPIGRTVEDCALVLAAINGSDAGDPSSVDVPFSFDARAGVGGMRLGYHPSWFEGRGATDLDRAVLDTARRAGLELVEIDLPDWPYSTLLTILEVEAATAFEELTLSGRDDELVWQEPQAWPNTFRRTRFTPAVELVQADRFRRRVMEMMAERFADVHAIISPSYAASLLLITNSTGHPSLTIRSGFQANGRPHGITLCGRLYDEGTLCTIGMALEKRLAVWDERPALETP